MVPTLIRISHIKRAAILSLNSSVLILFVIEKVITGFSHTLSSYSHTLSPEHHTSLANILKTVNLKYAKLSIVQKYMSGYIVFDIFSSGQPAKTISGPQEE